MCLSSTVSKPVTLYYTFNETYYLCKNAIETSVHTYYPGKYQAKVLTKLTESYISKKPKKKQKKIHIITQNHYCAKKRKKRRMNERKKGKKRGN
jgi:hypothetical protein